MDTKETTNMNTNIKKEVSESKTNESVTSPKEEQSTEHHQPSLKTDSFDPKPEEIINLYPKKPSLNKSGRSIQLVSNYFPFSFPNKETQKSFFKYAVLFNPDIPGDSVNLRKKLIRQIDSKIIEVYGQYFFNNTVLYSIQLCAIAGYLGCLCEIQLQKWYFWKQVRGVTELRIPGSVR